MLQRQIWRQLNHVFHPYLVSCPLRHRTSRIKSIYNVTCHIPYAQIARRTYGSHNHAKLLSSIPSSEGINKTKEPSIDPRRNTKSRPPEPWIIPESLSESLEAHRKANNEGVARDGILQTVPKRRQRKDLKHQLQQGLWPGMDVLHLPSTDLSQKRQIEYGGVCPPLLSEWHPSASLPSRLRFPWSYRIDLHTGGKRHDTALERLSAEMIECDRYFSASPTESDAAARAFAQIKEILVETMGFDVCVDLVGSRAAGTEGPVSDIDININIGIQDDKNDACRATLTREQFRRIYAQLHKKHYADIVLPHVYISKTYVPIIVGTHLPSGLEFQVQSTLDVQDSLEVTRAFIAEYPKACVLFKIIKQILLMRGLGKGASGGVTSYPLLNMVVTSLKLASSHTRSHDIATQLLEFLNFWSDFDFKNQKIVLTSPDAIGIKSDDTPGNIDPISAVPRIVSKVPTASVNSITMSLEDPADVSNDLGRSTSGIKHVQACFIQAREEIRKAMAAWDHAYDHGLPTQNQSPILAWCLGGNYTAFEEARLQVQDTWKEEQGKMLPPGHL